MSNFLNFILPHLHTIKILEYYNNEINHENLWNHCMARGSDIFFFFKLIIPEIQHLGQHNGQKKCTIGESYNASIWLLRYI